jgi:hypothetical protein
LNWIHKWLPLKNNLGNAYHEQAQWLAFANQIFGGVKPVDTAHRLQSLLAI